MHPYILSIDGSLLWLALMDLISLSLMTYLYVYICICLYIDGSLLRSDSIYLMSVRSASGSLSTEKSWVRINMFTHFDIFGCHYIYL